MICSNTAAELARDHADQANEDAYGAIKDRLGERCIDILLRKPAVEVKRLVSDMGPDDTLIDFALCLYHEQAERELRDEFQRGEWDL